MPTTFTGSLPPLLSQTGVFSNTPAMTPAGRIDSLSAQRAALVGRRAEDRVIWPCRTTAAPSRPDEQIAFAPTGTWTFPAGTVFVKTFELQHRHQAIRTSLRRLETRLLVRDINGAVYGVTYKWRPDNSDADLLTSSLYRKHCHHQRRRRDARRRGIIPARRIA